MHVIAIHEISDPKRFFDAAGTTPIPEGIELHSVLPNKRRIESGLRVGSELARSGAEPRRRYGWRREQEPVLRGERGERARPSGLGAHPRKRLRCLKSVVSAGLPRIREAGVEDADAIARVHVLAWREAYRDLIPDRVIAARAVDRPWQWTWRLGRRAEREPVVVAEAGEEIVGFASGGPSPDDDLGGDVAEVTGLYVHPDHWRQGIGRALLAELLLRLRRDGFGSATLWVLADNAPARRFYEAAGWKLEGAERRHPERRALEVGYRLERLGSRPAR